MIKFFLMIITTIYSQNSSEILLKNKVEKEYPEIKIAAMSHSCYPNKEHCIYIIFEQPDKNVLVFTYHLFLFNKKDNSIKHMATIPSGTTYPCVDHVSIEKLNENSFEMVEYTMYGNR